MRSREPGVLEELVEAAFRGIWGFRVEITVATGSAGAWQAIAETQGAALAWAAIGGTTLLALALPPARRALRGLLVRARVRRQWHRAVRSSRSRAFETRLPSIRSVTEIPAGERLDIRMPLGTWVGDLEDAAEVAAASLGVREVRVRRDPANANHAEVVIVRRDPLAGGDPLVWPLAEVERTSLWEPIAIGLGEDGHLVTMALPERNLLLGGEPGAGKSAALSLPVAAAALDPTVKLWLLDGKLVELATWAGCAEHSVGVNVAEAVDVLRSLQHEMQLRYAELLACRKRKVTAAEGMPLHVVVCDELAHYLTAPDRKDRTEFAEVLRDLVSRGRAAGVIVLAATQKPGSDIVPTSLRDLFGFRWAMRCSTPQASDTILGSGWASAGFSATEIDAACRGVGYLLHEGGLPVRVRACYLDDETLAALADRAEALRRTPAASEGS